MKIFQPICMLILVSVVLATVYGSVQQGYRSSASDPQREAGAELKEKWERGRLPAQLFADTVRIGKSLASFAAIYDSAGHALHTNGLLDGSAPVLPDGALRKAKASGGDWLTWQPSHNLRIALNVLRADTHPASFVVVGRPMQLADERTTQLRLLILVSWAFCVCVICVHAALPVVAGLRAAE